MKVLLICLSMMFSLQGRSSSGSAYRLYQEKQEEIKNSKIRGSAQYQRIYKICSRPLELSKLRYAAQSAKQVIKLSAISEDEVSHLVNSKSGLSKTLYDDLESEGFYLAVRDCRLTTPQTNTLVASLLLLDGSGKLLGGAASMSGFKLISKAATALKVKSAEAYWGIVGTGIASTIHSVYKRHHTSERSDDGVTVSSREDLDKIMDLEEKKEELEDHTVRLIQRIKGMIAELEMRLGSENLSSEEIKSIEIRIQELETRIEVLEFSL